MKKQIMPIKTNKIPIAIITIFILTFSIILPTTTYASEISIPDMEIEKIPETQKSDNRETAYINISNNVAIKKHAKKTSLLVNTEDELQNAIKNNTDQDGVFIKLANNITISQTINIDKKTYIDLAGYKIEGNGNDLILNILTTGELTLESTADTNGLLTNGGQSAIVNDGTAIIKNIAIKENSSNYGGAIYNKWGSNLTLSNVNITKNTAKSCGGAIYNEEYGFLKLADVEITENSARCGGAIYSEEYGFLKLKRVKIIQNTAQSDENGIGVGGGIYSYEENLIDFENVTINNNIAYNAGGIYMRNNNNNSENGQYKFKNITISGNNAESKYGGIQAIFMKNKEDENKLELEGKVYIAENMCNNTPSDLNVNFDSDFCTPIKISKNGLTKNSKIGLWFSTEYISNEGNIIISDFSKTYLPYFVSNSENIKIGMKQDDSNSLYATSKDLDMTGNNL